MTRSARGRAAWLRPVLERLALVLLGILVTLALASSSAQSCGET